MEREDVESLPVLRDIVLNEADKDMARMALFHLAEIEDKEALGLLRQVLASSKDEEIRRIALMAMGERGGVEAKEALLKVALESADDEMAMMAVFALAEMREDLGADIVRNIMKNAKSQRARRAVLMALMGDEGEAPVAVLVEILKTEQDRDLKEYAIHSLSQSARARTPGWPGSRCWPWGRSGRPRRKRRFSRSSRSGPSRGSERRRESRRERCDGR
jgi:HEAT repeat protein